MITTENAVFSTSADESIGCDVPFQISETSPDTFTVSPFRYRPIPDIDVSLGTACSYSVAGSQTYPVTCFILLLRDLATGEITIGVEELLHDDYDKFIGTPPGFAHIEMLGQLKVPPGPVDLRSDDVTLSLLKVLRKGA
jgi:hypothetical protein